MTLLPVTPMVDHDGDDDDEIDDHVEDDDNDSSPRRLDSQGPHML